MKILVTGGAGYIGSVLVLKLLNKGYSVVMVDNLMYGQSPLLDCCYHKTFRFIKGEAQDQELIQRLISDADVIIPLACITGAPACDENPQSARMVIVEGLQNILRYERGDQLIIYPNTNSGYGVGLKSPDAYCDENTPLNPISLYGRLKVLAEKRLLDAKGPAIIFRLATVFGGSQRMRIDLMVNHFVYRAVTDRYMVLFEPDARRNFIHVQDVARAFLWAIDRWVEGKVAKPEIFNLGLSDANLSKRDLCERIKLRLPDFFYIPAPIGKDPDKRDYIVSNEKIEAAGFMPQYSLDDGIQELIKVFSILNPMRPEVSNV